MRDRLSYGGVQFRRYDWLFFASRSGKLLRVVGKLYLAPVEPRVRLDGYLEVGRGSRLVHRMVALCWVKRPAGTLVVHHINGNKADNRAENLLWVKPRDHMKHHPGTGQGRYVRTKAIRQKLRESRLGKKLSEATKRKIGRAIRSLGIKPPSCLGRVRPEKERAWMRENNWNNSPCVVQGVRYRSFSEAGRAIGMKPHTLRKRCLSETSFPDFKSLQD